MKKIVMMASTAALAFGLGSCVTEPAENGGGGDLSADQAGLRISFTMPSSSGNTRAADRAEIVGTPEENKVSSVSVFVFKADKTAPEIAWAKVPDGEVDNWFDAANGTYTMKSDPDIKLTVSAGNDMRIWVAVNLPAELDKEYSSEASMLAATGNVVDMAVADHFTMFSNVRADIDLVKDVTNTQLTGAGAVDVNRVVSKIIATEGVDFPHDGNNFAIWAGITSTEHPGVTDAVVLRYELRHWFVVQDAIVSYVAPHYNVNAYNGPSTYVAAYAVHPETYKGTGFLRSYANSVSPYDDAHLELTDPRPNDTQLESITGRYIGENASLINAQTSDNDARKGNTTYAFISTKVQANAEATWNFTTQKVEWKTVTDYPLAADTANDDIWVVNWDGYEWFTSSEVKAQGIQTGIAVREGAKLGIIVGDGPDDQDVIGDDPDEMSIEDFFAAHESAKADIYKYANGYVHFIHWINKIDADNNGTLDDNHYDILRNQFIHLDITGLKAVTTGNFPGYPGQDPDDGGDPKIPTDPTDNTDPNNPDPFKPENPVDPSKADLKVDIKIRPWTYRYNNVPLGR